MFNNAINYIRYAVGDYPFAIESSVDTTHLNNVVNQLLKGNDNKQLA